MNIIRLPKKFHNLVLLENDADVPPCLCLGQAELADLFADFTGVVDAAGAVLDRIKRTSGAFLAEDLAEIHRITAALRPAEDAERILAGRLAPRFGPAALEAVFAVRSANLIEDTGARSFAGLYDSFLDVTGAAGLLAAIRAVWMSAYSRAVVTERIHAGLLDAGNPMNVIVQKMVPAAFAGVAFSRNPVTGEDRKIVEIVEGCGDALVSGLKAGSHYSITDAGEVPPVAPDHRRLVDAVTGLLKTVEGRLATPVDIEWAWDGDTVWLLQARPITSLGHTEHDPQPHLLVTDLYGDDTADLDRMAPLPEFASYFREKRKRIADFARRHGLGFGTALVVRLNAAGLDLPDFRNKVLDAHTSEEVVLDFSGQIRQVILPRDRLVEELRQLLSRKDQLHTIVLRDFIRGDAGIITHLAAGTEDDPAVVGEWSSEGLLAINRGTAATSLIRLGGGTSTCDGLPDDTARRLHAATVAAHAEIGPVQIEWVKLGPVIYPLDFSVLSEDAVFAEAGDGTVISRGYALGPVLVLDDNRDLELLSIAPSVSLTDIPDASQMGPAFERLLDRIRVLDAPPVVVCSRPLAALAPLLPHVGGFVFQHAAVLSHLSILVREKGLPAVQAPQLYDYARGKETLLLDVGDEVLVSSAADAGPSAPSPSAFSNHQGEASHVLAE